MAACNYWIEHGVHSSPLNDEIHLLRHVADAAWHMLDEGGEHDDGLYVVSAQDWKRLSDALDAAGWSPDAMANARSTGSRMAPKPKHVNGYCVTCGGTRFQDGQCVVCA